MKLGSFFVSIAVLITLNTLNTFAFADTPLEATARIFLKNKMNVDLAKSCSLTEHVNKDPGGPFEHNDYCNEKDYRKVSSISGKVYRVVDGDTISFHTGGKLLSIRMLGVDTPELHFQSMAQPKWGMKARDSLRSMVEPGDAITLELDQVKCDRFGRILGHVFKGNVNLNFEQVRRGVAVNYCISPNMKHCNAYSMAYVKAEDEHLGMHGDSCLVTPYVWRRAMNHQLMTKTLKDSRNDQMYAPKDYYRVPIAYRVFFADTLK